MLNACRPCASKFAFSVAIDDGDAVKPWTSTTGLMVTPSAGVVSPPPGANRVTISASIAAAAARAVFFNVVSLMCGAFRVPAGSGRRRAYMRSYRRVNRSRSRYELSDQLPDVRGGG